MVIIISLLLLVAIIGCGIYCIGEPAAEWFDE